MKVENVAQSMNPMKFDCVCVYLGSNVCSHVTFLGVAWDSQPTPTHLLNQPPTQRDAQQQLGSVCQPNCGRAAEREESPDVKDYGFYIQFTVTPV